MPGLGQVYVGYYPQGFAHILTILAAFAVLASGVMSNRLEPVVGMFIAFFWLYNVVDAGRRASLYNQALRGLRPMDLPEDGKVPMRVGSMAGGVVLIVAGLVLSLVYTAEMTRTGSPWSTSGTYNAVLVQGIVFLVLIGLPSVLELLRRREDYKRSMRSA